MEKYIFQPLPKETGRNFVRVLTILADDNDDDPTLRCLISYESLDTPTPYEALSYCYGTGPCDERILVKDEGTSDSFFYLDIMSNLHMAMEHLRSSTDPRRIWIDALCISQVDLQEKMSQIKLMRAIYLQAERVLIWLGEEADGSDEAMDLIPKITQVIACDKLTGFKRDLTYITNRPDIFPPMVTPCWENLYKILRRPWFRRAWIIQELALAREAIVICGQVEVDWDDFQDAFKFLLKAGGYGLHYGIDHVNVMLQHHDIREKFIAKQHMSLQQVLTRNRILSASHPLDSVYAYHSLFQPGTLGALTSTPNYHITYRELCINVAYAILHESGNLHLLAHGRYESHSQGGQLPTWVPDWLSKEGCEGLRWSQIEQRFEKQYVPPYSASAGTSYTLRLSDSDAKLHLRGFTITEIAALSVTCLSQTSMNYDHEVAMTNLRIYDSFEKVACTNIHPLFDFETLHEVATMGVTTGQHLYYTYDFHDTWYEAFYKTLLAGNLHGESEENVGAMFVMWYWKRVELRALRAQAEDNGSDLEQLIKDHIMEKGNQMAELEMLFEGLGLEQYGPLAQTTILHRFGSMIRPCERRRMMKAENGMIGLVPQIAQEGDLIVLIEGADTPFVLRKTSTDDGGSEKSSEYEFVGETYVHGLMDGAAWMELKIQGAEMEDFVLI